MGVLKRSLIETAAREVLGIVEPSHFIPGAVSFAPLSFVSTHAVRLGVCLTAAFASGNTPFFFLHSQNSPSEILTLVLVNGPEATHQEAA